MRRLLLLCTIPWLLAADDHWVKFTRGPFEVMTDAAPRGARETVVRFEQFRNALGQIVGEDDLQTPLPVRIFVFKSAKGWTSAAPITEGRDRFCIVLGEKSAVTPEIYSELARLFLKSNTTQMPAAFERGLIAFFSTFEVNGIRITAGKPPARPDLDWARIHLMVADPDYYGKIRVLLLQPAPRRDGRPGLSQRVRQVRGGGGGRGQKPLRRREFPNHAAAQPRDGGKRFSGAAGVGGGERPGARRPAGGRAIGGRISEIAGGTREDRGSRRGARTVGAARRAHR